MTRDEALSVRELPLQEGRTNYLHTVDVSVLKP